MEVLPRKNVEAEKETFGSMKFHKFLVFYQVFYAKIMLEMNMWSTSESLKKIDRFLIQIKDIFIS